MAILLARFQWAAARRNWVIIPSFIQQANSILTGADVEHDASVGPGWLLSNPLGISLWGHAGEDFTLSGLSGLGHSISGRLAAGGRPSLGDRIRMETLTGVQGPLTIGDDCLISAGAGVRRSMGDKLRARPKFGPTAGQFPERRLVRPDRDCPHRSWKTTWSDFCDDLRRTQSDSEALGFGRPSLISLLFQNMFIALFLHRLAHHLSSRKVPLLPRLVDGLNGLVFKIRMGRRSCLRGGILLPHLAGTSIQADAAERFTAYAQAWVGDPAGPPARFGAGGFVAAHSYVAGGVSIGSECVVGLKSVVFGDLGHGVVVNSVSMVTAVDDEGRSEDVSTPVSPPMQRRTRLKTLLREDRQAWKRNADKGACVSTFGKLAVTIFRLSAFFDLRDAKGLARWLWLLNRYLTGVDISPCSRIGGGLTILVAPGVTFRGCAGRNLTLHGQLGVGADPDSDRSAIAISNLPAIGDDVTIMPHCVLKGGLTVGDSVVLGPGVIPTGHVESGTVLCAPGVRVRSRKSESEGA